MDTMSRRQFWKFFDDENPALFEAFVKKGILLLFFSVRIDLCQKCKNMSRITSAAWACSFRDRALVAGTFVFNPTGPINSVIVKCEVPRSLLALDISLAENVSVSLQEVGGAAHVYADVPFCRYPDVPDPAPPGRAAPLLAACTMLKSGLNRYAKRNSDLLLEWLAYHRLQGVGHFLVYAHEDPAELRRLLAPLVAEGAAAVVDWESPPYPRPVARRGEDFVPYQFLQTTSCLHRYRGLAEWVGLFDVDEFAQPLAPEIGRAHV